jgi:hypothetical protein
MLVYKNKPLSNVDASYIFIAAKIMVIFRMGDPTVLLRLSYCRMVV